VAAQTVWAGNNRTVGGAYKSPFGRFFTTRRPGGQPEGLFTVYGRGRGVLGGRRGAGCVGILAAGFTGGGERAEYRRTP